MEYERYQDQNAFRWKVLALFVILTASSVTNITVMKFINGLRDEILIFHDTILETSKNASQQAVNAVGLIQNNVNNGRHAADWSTNGDVILSRDRRSHHSDASDDLRGLRGKMFRFELDYSNKEGCVDKRCEVNRYETAGVTGWWFYPGNGDDADQSLRVSIQNDGTQVTLLGHGGFFYIFAHITFGPTNELDACYNTGFSLLINGVPRVESRSTNSIAVNGRHVPDIDCPTFTHTQQANFITELSCGDTISIATLYDRLTIWKFPEMSFWGLVQQQ